MLLAEIRRFRTNVVRRGVDSPLVGDRILGQTG